MTINWRYVAVIVLLAFVFYGHWHAVREIVETAGSVGRST
jgi:hypothetical protein